MSRLKVTTAIAASALALSSVAAQAAPVQRASAPATETQELAAGSPLLIIAAIIGALIALELTGAINIIDGDDAVSA